MRKAGKRLCEADESECTEAGWSAIGSRLGGTDKAHRLLHGGAHNAAIPSKDDPDSDDKRTRESSKEALAQPTAPRDIQRTLASAETTRLYGLAGMCTTAFQRVSRDVEEATVAAGEAATALQKAQSEITHAFFHGLTPLSGAPLIRDDDMSGSCRPYRALQPADAQAKRLCLLLQQGGHDNSGEDSVDDGGTADDSTVLTAEESLVRGRVGH